MAATFMVSCSLNKETSEPTITTTAPALIVVPTAGEMPATVAALANTPSATPVATEPPGTSVATTDVVGVVITAAEATLYSGPGEDYPVVATGFGGSNYPVTGISEDEQWWRLTCYDDALIAIDACWASTDPSITAPTTPSATAGSEIQPYIELTFDFLRAIQSGLTAAGSEQYLSHDLQTVVEAGRPLPGLFGIRDAFPSFVITDFSDAGAKDSARVRVRFIYDSPTYAVISLISEEGTWKIDKVAAHNLVKSFGTSELILAEDVITAYYAALVNDEPEAAFDLLTSEMQERTDPRDLASITTGLEKLTVSTLQPIRGTADQVVYYVRLLAVPDESQPAVDRLAWRDGENARWVTLVQNKEGWRIAQIINSPILTEIQSWQRVNVQPIDMTLDIPADWQRAGLPWAWSPNSLGTPAIGVSWTDLGEFGGDETLLPRSVREISNRAIDLGWAQGTQYTFEVMGGPGEGPTGAESHIIVKTGQRAYDFYAIATEVEELDNMRPILQRMVAAVAITDPQASAFNSIETSTNFLATLLRDGTGSGSLPYLSDELRARVVDQSSLLSLLGSETLFQSFTVSWQKNPAAGQALVGVTLIYPDSTEELLFTVERDDNNLWHITEIMTVVSQSR